MEGEYRAILLLYVNTHGHASNIANTLVGTCTLILSSPAPSSNKQEVAGHTNTYYYNILHELQLNTS